VYVLASTAPFESVQEMEVESRVTRLGDFSSTYGAVVFYGQFLENYVEK
jgi:hypothetical protein